MAAGTWMAGAIVGKLIMDKTGWTSAAKSISDDLGKMSGLSKSTADSFKKAGTIMIGIGGAIAGAIYGVAKAADESARVQGQMNAVLKSTGGVAGLTAGELNNLAAGLQKVTTYDDEAILGGQNLLLTFTSIGKDVFPAATAAMLDMSTALGQDLKGSAVQLGKALQDPVLGVLALRKAGVSFSDAQRDMIKRLVETGDKLGAQKIILGELSKEFGGSALAAAQTFGGQLTQLKNSVGDLKESIGAAFLPILKDMVAAIKPIAEKMREWVDAHPELISLVAKAAVGVGALMLALGPFVFMVPKIIAAFNALKIALVGMNIGFIAVIGGLLAVGAAIDKLINKYKAQQDAEMRAIIKQSGPVAEALRMRHELIKAQIVTHEEWRDLFNKAGRDYGKMMEMISTDPAYKTLKDEWDKIKTKQDEAKKSTKETGDQYEELSGKLKAAEEWQKKFGEAMQTWGIKTLKEKQDRIGELLGFERDLGQLLKDGQLSTKDYGEAMKKLKEELFGYGEAIKTALPPARDFRDLVAQAPGQVNDLVYAMQTEEDQLKDIARELGVATNEALAYMYQMKQLQVFLTTGIWLPDIDFGVIRSDAREATEDIGNSFDDLWSDVAKSFGSSFETIAREIGKNLDFLHGEFFDHGINFKAIFKDLWGSIKDSFFSMCGEIATKWVKGLMTDLVDSAGKAATGATTAFSGLGTTITGIAGTIGTVITTLATAIATAIGTIATGIGTAIVAVATAVASAATILAAAVVPLLTIGAAALALYIAFQLAKGLLDKLLGTGGGDKKANEWIHEIRDKAYDINNFMIGTVKPWFASTDKALGGYYEKFDGLKGSVDLTRTSILDQLYRMIDHLAAIRERLKKMAGAQKGLRLEQPGIIMTHGTPQEPEWVIPESRLLSMATAAPAAAGARQFNFQSTVNLEGTVVTDREYVRSRLMPELISALTSTEFRGKVQRALGVA